MKRINTTQRSPGIQIAVLLLLLSSCTSGEQETGIGRPLEVTAEIAAPEIVLRILLKLFQADLFCSNFHLCSPLKSPASRALLELYDKRA